MDPLLQYHGGKFLLAPWILSHFPPHRTYVEAYGGGGSILLRKHRSPIEIYNDLDGNVVNLFKMVRERSGELTLLIERTPYARQEKEESDRKWMAASLPPLERARILLVRSWMTFGGLTVGGNNGFSFDTNHNSCVLKWNRLPKTISIVCARLKQVTIENRSAIKLMGIYDSPRTLHYLDPPYIPESRDKGKDYLSEMTEEDHHELLHYIQTLKGSVIISGYGSELYKKHLKKWKCLKKKVKINRNVLREEHLWLSPNVKQNGFGIY